MNRSFVVLTVLLTGIILAFGFQRARQAAAKPGAQPGIQEESLDVQLARAHVALARLNLRQAEEANQETGGVYTNEFIEKLRFHVEVDEANLQQCLQGEDADAHQVCVRQAEASVKLAEAELKRQTFLNRLSNTDEAAISFERAKIMSEIAKLNLEKTKASEASESVLTHLQSQIDLLRHEVMELQLNTMRR